MKFLTIIALFSLVSCIPDGQVGNTTTNSTSNQSTNSDYLTPEQAQKKLGGISSNDPRQCASFILFAKENCVTDAQKVEQKCVRTQEYIDTCKELYGQCPQKHAISTVKSLAANNDSVLPKNSFKVTRGGTLTSGEFSLEMGFLSGVDNMCDRSALMLTMCNTRTHYEECSGCRDQLSLYEICDQNPSAPGCEKLAAYYNECQLPCK